MSSLKLFFFLSLFVSFLVLGVLFFTGQKGKNFVMVTIKGAKVLAEVADDRDAEMKGLSGRTNLLKNYGMLFLFSNPAKYGFWMKDMKFPLDIIWIRAGRVVDIEENVPNPLPGIPEEMLPVYRPDVPADRVLEVVSGFVRTHGITIGEDVEIREEPKGALAALSLGAEDKNTGARGDAAGNQFFIESLRGRASQGHDFKIIKKISENSDYTKFAVSYGEGNLEISGIMNVPKGGISKEKYPLLILNHGLIPREIYYSGRGSRREQDFFARHGYVTIHPDYRGLASSSPDLSAHHDFYVGYTEDVIALIDALKNSAPDFIDTKRIGMWGHSMGGGIASRVMVLRPEIRAFVLFAPISADAEDNFYELKRDEINWLHQTYGEAHANVYRLISPLTYFKDVEAPIQLHHAPSDPDVPYEFSQKMYEALRENQKKVEFFSYPGEKHEFINAWPIAAGRALQFFDKYVKNAR